MPNQMAMSPNYYRCDTRGRVLITICQTYWRAHCRRSTTPQKKIIKTFHHTFNGVLFIEKYRHEIVGEFKLSIISAADIKRKDH